ncbi:MAG: SDR family oxidoreductase [Chlorobi bacterium]|nr:SDR family oxidoreductase [Chlorobiota bacterium]
MKEKRSAVWITGASSGIGKAIALEFIRNGVDVIASSRKVDSLKRNKDEFNNELFHYVPLDVTKHDAVKSAAKEIFKSYDICCLINNAGITTFSQASKDSHKVVDGIIKTNLLGAISTIQNVLPHFKKKGRGLIINILSIVVRKTFQNSSAYSASKAGLLAYTNVLREEVRTDNIKVVNILPGATRTPIWPAESLSKYANKMMSPRDIAKFIFEIYKLKSNLVPEEIVLRPLEGDI